jgi:hypothetical protein
VVFDERDARGGHAIAEMTSATCIEGALKRRDKAEQYLSSRLSFGDPSCGEGHKFQAWAPWVRGSRR